MKRPERGEPPKGGLMVSGFHDEAELEEEHDLGLLARLLPYLKPHLLLLGFAMLLMPVTSLASLVQPYLVKLAIDAALVERSTDALLVVVGYFATAVVGEFIARFGQVYLMQLAGQRTMADLRREVFRHIQRLRVGYFDRTPVGRVVTRVTNDIDSLAEFFASGAVTAVADVIMLVGIVAFMLYLDWELTLLAFAAVPPMALMIAVFRRYARDAFRKTRARIAQLNAYLAEQVNGVAVVQAFGREARCRDEYRWINAGYRDANLKAIRFDALLFSVVEAVATASVAIVLWYASTRAELADPAVSAAYIGTVVAFYEYIQRFFVPIRDLSTKYTIIQQALASAERIFTLLDTDEPDAPSRSGESLGDAPKVDEDVAVAFEDVTFAYREGHPVLHDVSFRVRRGETVAIVGATGSGKTTTTSLLLRLYDYDVGHVLVDGEDVRTLDRHDLRARFAMVPQDVFLFAGTVLENVTLGREVDRDRAREALERVGAWALLEGREGGLDAVVDERGQNFSAGERQLIAFARALYRDPQLLILDEATANIDSETEARLQKAVLSLVEGRTSLVIAHRLSTIRHADRILVFHRGRIAEQGTHDELLAADGIYARLHRLSFETQVDEGGEMEHPTRDGESAR